jgi:outer membrane immunogenic protein
MNKRLLSVAAGAVVILAVVPSHAADPAVLKEPPILAAPGVNWSGFYGGVNFGVAKGYKYWSGPTGPVLLAAPHFPAQGDQNGIFGGATAGYNHQIGAWVFGLESDVSFASNYGNAVCGGAWGFGGAGWNCQSTTDVLASFTPRAGYALSNALLYVKGGLAYAHDNYAAVLRL